MEPGPWGAKAFANEPEWSPDWGRLLERVVHPDLKQAQILLIHPATGKSSVAFEDRDAAWIEPPFAGWAPDSRHIYFTSERDGWAHLYVSRIGAGAPVEITHGPWEIHNERTWGHDPQWIGAYIYYSSTEGATAERQCFRVHPDGSGKERITHEAGLNVCS